MEKMRNRRNFAGGKGDFDEVRRKSAETRNILTFELNRNSK